MPSGRRMPRGLFLALVTIVLFAGAAAGAEIRPRPEPRTGSPERPGPSSAPEAFGGYLYSVSSVSDLAFVPFDSSVNYSTAAGTRFRFATASPASFGSTIVLPAGAVIDYIGLGSCDLVGGRFSVGLRRQYADGTFTDIDTFNTTPHGGGAPCRMDYSPGVLGYQIDANTGASLQLFVSQNPGAPTDGSVNFSSVEVWRFTKVSPAPAAASFLDVPTSNPFFQYVEALKASGITGGCGDGSNFCPDQPVLRKQMAVFLAKALGLAYPY